MSDKIPYTAAPGVEVYLFRTWPYRTAVAVRYPGSAVPGAPLVVRARALTQGGAQDKALKRMARP